MRHVDVSSQREGTDAMQENLVANRNHVRVGNYLCLDYKNNRGLKEKKQILKSFSDYSSKYLFSQRLSIWSFVS